MANEPFDLKKNIIAVLGLESLPEERRIALLNTASELVQKRVMIRLLEGLSDEDAAEGAKLSEDPEAFTTFLAEKSGVDLLEAIEQEVQTLKNELQVRADEDVPVNAALQDDTEI